MKKAPACSKIRTWGTIIHSQLHQYTPLPIPTACPGLDSDYGIEKVVDWLRRNDQPPKVDIRGLGAIIIERLEGFLDQAK